MKQGKVLGMILGMINVILIVVCLFFFLRTDRTAPALTFQAYELTYTSGMDQTRLLEGITAYDSNDGDITDRIVIEKMIENREDNTLIVFYAVSDQAGNVAKASREFGARFLDQNTDPKSDIQVEEIKEAGIEAEFDVKINHEQEPDETPEPAEVPSPETSIAPSPEASIAPSPTPTPKATPTAAPAMEPVQEQVQHEEPVMTTEPPAQAPTFTLKVSEIKTKVGVPFALVDVIGSLSDEKDSYETLFHNIVVSKYDVNQPGTYHVTLTTQDSEGNVSPARPLTIIVE